MACSCPLTALSHACEFSRVEMPDGGALENEIVWFVGSWFLDLRGEESAGMKGPSVHPTFDKSRQLSLVQQHTYPGVME
jgi:hypothetical protein